MRVSQAIGIVAAALFLTGGTARGQFTTIINLPGDPVLTSISAGTQLNVFEEGRLSTPSGPFTAWGGEVNVLGGSIASNYIASGDSVTNLSSGAIYSLTGRENATVNISGGAAGSSRIRAEGSSRINITGGSIGRSPNSFEAFDTSSVTISGGLFEGYIQASNQAHFDISGGLFRQNVRFSDTATAAIDGGIFSTSVMLVNDSHARIAGGSFLSDLSLTANTSLTLAGSDFRLDGVPIDGAIIPGSKVTPDLTGGEFLSGVFADGTPFEFRTSYLKPGALELEATELPPHPVDVHVPDDAVPAGLRRFQTLTLSDGGSVPEYFIAGRDSRLIMTGGQLAGRALAQHAELRISGGEVLGPLTVSGGDTHVTGGTFAQAYFRDESNIHLEGGDFQQVSVSNSTLVFDGATTKSLQVSSGSTGEISGGSIGGLGVSFQGNVSMSRGLIAGTTRIQYSGTLDASGGTFGKSFELRYGGQLHLIGDEFKIDGDPIPGLDSFGDSLQVNLPTGAMLSGVLSDGTPFYFGSERGDRISNSTFIIERAPLPPRIGTTEVVVTGELDLPALRTGRRMTITETGKVGDYLRSGDGVEITINGGMLGSDFEGMGNDITLNGGSIGDFFKGFVRSRLTMEDGSVGNYGLLSGESTLEMQSGTLGESFALSRGSTGVIESGTIGAGFNVRAGSTVTIYDGQFGGSFRVGSNPPRRGTEGDGDVSAAAITVPPRSTAHVYGGTFGDDLNVYAEGILNFHAGQAGHDARIEGTLNLTGGEIGDNMWIQYGVVNIDGGSIGSGLRLIGSTVPGIAHVHGGTIGPRMVVAGRGQAHIHGGTIGDEMRVESNGELTLYGTHFTLPPPTGDGPEVDLMSLLTPNVPYLLTLRDTTLTAKLADGSPFDLGLFTSLAQGQDYVSPGAKVYLVLVQVPETGTLTLALLALLSYLPLHRRRLLPR